MKSFIFLYPDNSMRDNHLNTHSNSKELVCYYYMNLVENSIRKAYCKDYFYIWGDVRTPSLYSSYVSLHEIDQFVKKGFFVFKFIFISVYVIYR